MLLKKLVPDWYPTRRKATGKPVTACLFYPPIRTIGSALKAMAVSHEDFASTKENKTILFEMLQRHRNARTARAKLRAAVGMLSPELERCNDRWRCRRCQAWFRTR